MLKDFDDEVVSVDTRDDTMSLSSCGRAGIAATTGRQNDGRHARILGVGSSLGLVQCYRADLCRRFFGEDGELGLGRICGCDEHAALQTETS